MEKGAEKALLKEVRLRDIEGILNQYIPELYKPEHAREFIRRFGDYIIYPYSLFDKIFAVTKKRYSQGDFVIEFPTSDAVTKKPESQAYVWFMGNALSRETRAEIINDVKNAILSFLDYLSLRGY